MKEPERLLTGSDELAKLIASATNDVLEDTRVERVWQGVAAGVGTAAAGAAGGGLLKGTLLKLLGSTVAKIATVLVVGSGVAVAVTVHQYAGTSHIAHDRAPEPVVSVASPPEVLPMATVPSVTPEDLPKSVAVAPPPKAHVSAVQGQPGEGILLLRARQALATDPQRALDLVRQHDRDFPTSQLVPERDKLRAEAIAHGAK
jgi:hypothetical protein